MALGLPGGCLAPFGPTRKTNAPNMRRVAARIQKATHLDLGPGPPVNHPAPICTHSQTHGRIHTLAQIQQQSIYIYTKCTNLVIVRLTQWDKKAVEGDRGVWEECEYERAQWWRSSAEYGRRQTSRKSCLRWRAHKSRQRYLLKGGRGDNMFTHMLECLHASVCV